MVVAAVYKQAVADLQGFDSALMGRVLRICEALLASGAACSTAAKKLAVVAFSAFANQGPHPDSSTGEDAWVCEW